MANQTLAFKALADATRREVFERLAAGPKAVGELADELPVSRPAVSQHLKALKEAGLVSERRDGTRRVYQIDPNGLGEVRAWLDRFWDTALVAFQAEVARTARQERRSRKK
jgi:DNA-binding transcriptional ArsR family regulator